MPLRDAIADENELRYTWGDNVLVVLFSGVLWLAQLSGFEYAGGPNLSYSKARLLSETPKERFAELPGRGCDDRGQAVINERSWVYLMYIVRWFLPVSADRAIPPTAI